ncbi:hypothetical protein [Halalkalibacter alkalisediminis]|uniref:Lycopene cyclase domain-containing protein n=1 Tax=Halalkalibacter alkalisediminis TaxID=935616 RepID=A0ABV6NQZ3_9BACI|nr:hypothetical protein [Halalkalibacter alkalisediminis]
MTELLLWILFLGPPPLLLLLDLKRVKRFLSVAFFTLILTSIYWQMEEVWNWWTVKENLFFLTNISSFNYGFLPVVTIIVFYFTYHNVWLFFGTNLLVDAIQAFIVSPFVFERIGLYTMDNMSNFWFFLLLLSIVPVIYLYQRWYDSI